MTPRRQWPVLAAIALVWIAFQIANPNFLTAINLSNLMLQIAAMGTMAAGVVLVLLVGEIDLSAGAVSGLGAAVMGVLSARHGLPALWCVVLALGCGALIGLVQGVWIVRRGVPAFVVTLAGLLVWQGVLLAVLGNTGTLNLRAPELLALAGAFLPRGSGVLLGCVLAIVRLRTARRERMPALVDVACVFGAVVILELDRGVPVAVLICVGTVVSLHAFVTRTRTGRHLLAVGGNTEAARRAGVSTEQVRILAFVLCSTLAALGGVLGASRLMAVNQSSGGGDLLVNVIASAVVGGTSLFGGRGQVTSALWGALLIGSISNGMDLLALESSSKFVITGLVLLLAVTVDVTGRRRAAR